MRPFFIHTFIALVASLVLLCASTTTQAQTKQANNWFFGVNAGVIFNSGTPVAVTTSAMNVWEGSASMSDATTGALMFYTNGQTVWTRTNVAMPNGSGLLGDNSATQSALIVPNPNSSTKYWVFTVDKEGGANGLRYSEVDMTLNAGNGNVTAIKNVPLRTPVTEKLTAVKKCDGSGYFIVAHEWNTNNFLVYETTTTQPTPTFVRAQAIGMVHSNSSVSNAIGQMKISPNGKKLALATNLLKTVELYNFSNSTGLLSNLKTINMNTGADTKYCYGVEFSPNMKYLYVSTWYGYSGTRQISQYDISGTTIGGSWDWNSPQTVGALQLAPDGKIYYSVGDVILNSGRMVLNNSNLGVIATPNVAGGGAGWNNSAVALGGRTCDHGLPNFLPSIFDVPDNTKDFTFANLCYGSNTDFTSVLPTDADSVRFFFGDGFESYARNPSHLYPGAGAYTVKMKIFKGCKTDSVSKTVTIITCASSACNSGTGCFSPNLITNSDFQGGNTGFTSSFNPNNGTATCSTGANCGGTPYICANGYAIATSATPCNPTWSNNIRDHTTGAGNMMLVDFPNSGQNNIWCQSVSLTAGTNYCFGAYYINLLPAGSNQPTPTFIYTNNGTTIGNSATIPENEQWNFTGVNFTAAATASVMLCIKNQNVGTVGYDVAIDDIVLRSTLPGSPPTAAQDVIGLCGAATTGSVNVLANDTPGSAPMNNASLRIIQQAPFSQGVATANTATGVISFTASASFSGPVAVQYQICNTAGCCDNGTILIDQATTPVVPTVAITQDNAFPNCPAELVTFTATPTNGGANPSYQWSIDNVDVVGEVNTTFLTNTLTNGQIVKVTMTSNAICASPPIATAQVTAVITAMPIPTITGPVTLCEGAIWDLTAISPTAVLFEWSNSAGGNQYQSQPIAPGETASVTVTNAAGCTATATKTVVVTPVPTPSISATSLVVCQGSGGTTLTATGGTTYHWANGPFTDVYNIPNPIATAVYTVTATTNGCSATAEETVFVNSVFLTPMVSRTQCPNVTINLVASSNSTYEYTWGQEVGGTFSILVPSTVGANILVTAPIANSIYTVTATDVTTGCTATESVTITIGSGAPLTITGNTTICAGASTTLSASASTTYAWSAGTPTSGQSIIVTPVANTIYTVTISDASGCTNSKTVQVIVNAAPVAAISGTTAICNGAPTTLTASGGTSYLWNTADATSSITTPALTTATTYTVTATAANGCTSSKTQAVTINALPIISIAGPNAVCSNTTGTLTAAGAASYVWSTTASTASITTPNLTANTTYTVTATAASTCTNTASKTISINALPITAIAGGAAPICAGSNVTLTASTPVAGVTYSWGTAAFTSPILQNSTTYTVTTTATATGCTASSEQIVTVTPQPTATVTGNVPFCTGNGGITLTASGGTSYLWSNGTASDQNPINPTIPTTYTVTVTQNSCTSTTSTTVTPSSLTLAAMSPQSVCPNTNVTIGYTGLPANYSYNWSNGLGATEQVSFTSSATASYTVTVTDGNGCTAQQAVTVTVGSSPTPNITGTPASFAICAGKSITLTCANAVSYNWSTTATTQAITDLPIATTTYTVTITAAGGCTGTNSVTVTVNALPVATITGTNSICLGTNTSLTAALIAPSTASSYAWNNAPVNTTLATVSIAPSASTTYTVTVTDSNGCTDTESSLVTVNAVPLASIAGNTALCLGTNTTLTATVNTTPNTYIWNTIPNSSTDAITVTPTATTIYIVTATDANGCTDTESATVTVNANPSVSITGPSSVCANGSITLAGFSASAGATYAWNTGLPNPITDSPLIPTTYTVTVTDTNGCTAMASRNISVTPLPMPSITPANPSFCIGSGGVTLTAAGGTIYAWSSGASGANATVNPITITDYTVTATQNGCSSTATVTVTPNSLQLNAMPTQTICAGTSTTIGDPAIVGITYNWSSVLGTNANGTVTPLSNTNYTVTATDANGCTDVESVIVNVSALPVVPIIPDVTVCVGASATLTASGGGTYVWNNGGANPNIVVPAATTTYNVTVTNAATCTATRSVTVTVNPLPTVTITNGGVVTNTATICINNALNLVAQGGSTYIWNGATLGSNFAGTPPANTVYTVVGTDFNGCTDSETIAVTVNSLTIPAITNVQTCANAPVLIGYPTNNLNHTYAWSGGLVPLPNTNEVSVTIATTTTYTVTVTDITTGCTATQPVTATVNNNLQVNIIAPSAVCDGATPTLIATSPSVGATFDWSGTAGASIVVTPTVGGNNVYTVIATGTTGCTGSSTVAITVNPLPMPNITTTALNNAVCFGKTTPLTGNGGLNYIWDNTQNVQTITVAPVINPTIYTVTATDVNGCASSTTISIAINQLVMPPLTNATVCKGSPALIGYTDNTVTYDWGAVLGTTGQISPTPLTQTTYTVTVTDVNTCTTTSSATVNLFPDAVAVIPAIASICSGASATLVATGGVSSVWNVPNTTVSPIATTTYTVTITDVNGCTDSEVTSLTVNQLPTITIADPGSVCINSTITLQASAVPVGNMNYVWNNTTIGANNPITLFTGGVSTYTVTGTDANGCSNSTSRSVTVLVSPAPTVSISANQTSPLCAGTPITFTANVTDGGTNPTYQWFVIDVTTGATTPLGNSYPLVVNTSPLQGNLDYYAIVRSSAVCPAGDGISNNVSFVITPTVTPAISFVASATAICAGDAVTFTATVANEGTAPVLNWSINNVVQAGTTGVTFTPAALSNGDVISVELVSNAPCATPTQVTALPSITMIVNPIQAVTTPISASPLISCTGQNVIFTASPTNVGTSPQFQWTLNGVNVGTNQNTYQSAILTSSDIVAYTVTPSAGCNIAPVTSSDLSVTVNPTVQPQVALSLPLAVCQGQPITFTATPTYGGANPVYSWTVNAGSVTATGDTYTNSFLNEGDVVRVSLFSNEACPLSNNVTSNPSVAHVTPSIQPSIRIFTANPTVCAGSDVIFSSFITNGGANPVYQWQINGIIQTTTTSTFTVNTLLTGNVVSCALISDAICALNPTPSNTLGISVLPVITPDVVISTAKPIVCANTSTNYFATAVQGGGAVPVFNWSLNGVLVATGNPFRTSSILPGDILSVTMAANEQCAVGIATNTYTPNVQILTPSLTVRALDTCVLNKGKVYANVVGTVPPAAILPYTYRWSDTPSSFTDTLFNVSAAQTYTVTITDTASGCEVTDSIHILPTGSVTITSITTTPQLCTTLLSGSATVVHPKTNPPYLHIWTDVNGVGVSTDSVAVLAAGTYTVAVTDISGCIATQRTVVQVPLYPEVRVTPVLTTLVLGDSIQLVAITTAQETYVYAWSTADGLTCYTCKKPMARPVASSVYTVTITNAVGCTATASAEIVIDKQYNVYIPNIMTPNNDGANDNFVIHANSSVNLIKKITIFNRWGELVYSNQNMAANSDLSTWDGTFRGREVNNGVFVYIIEVEYVDGTTETFSGDVTVAR